MKKHTLAFIDLETTGTNPHKHEIIEIGGIIVRQIPQPDRGPKLEVIEEFEFKIKPQRIEDAEPQALRVNGYVEEEWLFAPSLKEVLTKITPKIKDCIMVGQNVHFDYNFLNEAYLQTEIKNPLYYHKIDILPIFFAKTYHNNNVNWYNLGTMAEFFGVKNEKAHTALADIRVTFEIYKRLLNIE
jgi:DNA polymerase III subunit epsilon